MASPAAKTSPLARDLTGRRLGRYEVLSQLASGGMATVYVARAQGVAGFERLVALKVLHPHLAHDEDFISMFLDEARLAARIRHPNAVGTLDISDSQGDGYFIVMEYVEGDHFGALLRTAAKAGERLPVPVIARIVMDALAGLSAAHTLTDPSGRPLDLVHRDVSPHNILIGTDGVARITDFGVAKAQVRLSSTRDGQFKGKLSYMAPEQAASGEADQRSDLFSMGIVLWEALTGRRLFRGENNADVLNKVLNCEVPPPSGFDAALAGFDAVAFKALAREPADRFQTAEEFLEAIEEAAASSGGVATARTVAREIERWLGPKVEQERKAVRDVMDALGRSELTPGVLPRPAETGSQPSHPQSAVRPIAVEDATLGAKPSTLERDATPRRAPVALLAIIVVLLLGLGGVGAWALFGRAPEPAPASAQPAQPDTTRTTDAVETADTPSAAQSERVGSEAAPVAGEDEQADVGEAEDDQAVQAGVEPPPERPARRGGRRGGRRATGGTDPASEPAAQQAAPGPSGDDDMIVNPYRR